MCFICRFNVYFSRNQRKCSQNGEEKALNFKFMRQMIYYLVGHEILNKTLYFVKRYYSQILRYLRKCMKKLNIIE